MIFILGRKTILLLFYLGAARAYYPFNDGQSLTRNVASNVNLNANINGDSNTGWNSKKYTMKIHPKIRSTGNGEKRFLLDNERFHDDADYQATAGTTAKAGLLPDFLRGNFTLALKRVLEELLALIDADLGKTDADADRLVEDMNREMGKIDVPESSDTNIQDATTKMIPPPVFYDDASNGTTVMPNKSKKQRPTGFWKGIYFGLKPVEFLNTILRPKIDKMKTLIQQCADKFFNSIK